MVNNKFLYKSDVYNTKETMTYRDTQPQEIEAINPNPSQCDIDQQWTPTSRKTSDSLTPIEMIVTNSSNISDNQEVVPLDPIDDVFEFLENHSQADSTPVTDSTDQDPRDERLEDISVDNCSSDPVESPIRLFNPGQCPHIPEKLLQDRPPNVGEEISFFDSRTNKWVDATVTANLSRKWNHYFNIIYENGNEDGLYLIPDTRWTLKPNLQEIHRHPPDQPTSLEPTPHTTPDKINPSEESNIDPEQTTPHETLSLDNSSSEPSNIDNNLNLTEPDSLQWDDQGTELLSSDEYIWPVDLHAVANLDHLLPLQLEPPPTTDANPPHLDQAFILEDIPPVSSTPSGHRRRIQQRRRTLPLESGHRQGFIQSFLRRLNPFKKKT